MLGDMINQRWVVFDAPYACLGVVDDMRKIGVLVAIRVFLRGGGA